MINTKCLLCQKVLLRRPESRRAVTLQRNKIAGSHMARDGQEIEWRGSQPLGDRHLGVWEPEARGHASLLQRRSLSFGHCTISTLYLLLLSCLGCLHFQEDSFWKAILLSPPCQRDEREDLEENENRENLLIS